MLSPWQPLSSSLTFGFFQNTISSVAQSCPALWDPVNCSTPGLLVHHQMLYKYGIAQYIAFWLWFSPLMYFICDSSMFCIDMFCINNWLNPFYCWFWLLYHQSSTDDCIMKFFFLSLFTSWNDFWLQLLVASSFWR